MSCEFSPTAGPTISGTATAPAYMMNRCCRPKISSFGSGEHLVDGMHPWFGLGLVWSVYRLISPTWVTSSRLVTGSSDMRIEFFAWQIS